MALGTTVSYSFTRSLYFLWDEDPGEIPLPPWQAVTFCVWEPLSRFLPISSSASSVSQEHSVGALEVELLSQFVFGTLGYSKLIHSPTLGLKKLINIFTGFFSPNSVETPLPSLFFQGWNSTCICLRTCPSLEFSSRHCVMTSGLLLCSKKVIIF